MTLDLKRLREIANAATPGPWRAAEYGAVMTMENEDVAQGDLGQVEENAAHIAAFNPETVIALLDRIEALEKKLGAGEIA